MAFHERYEEIRVAGQVDSNLAALEIAELHRSDDVIIGFDDRWRRHDRSCREDFADLSGAGHVARHRVHRIAYAKASGFSSRS
jgi:hypothetical protein